MRLLCFALVLMTFSSCGTYQYVTLDSPQAPKNAAGNLSWENDTLRVDYSYIGWGGHIWMAVYNKSNKPLYINWKKSALIKNTIAQSFFNPNTPFSGNFDATKGFTTSSGSLAGSFQLPDGMDFIPPGSKITKWIDLFVQSRPFEIGKLKDKPQLVKLKDQRGLTYTQTNYVFQPTASPLQFSTYLTFVLGTDNASEFAVSHSFYAKELVSSSKTPLDFNPSIDSRGDEFYLKITYGEKNLPMYQPHQ